MAKLTKANKRVLLVTVIVGIIILSVWLFQKLFPSQKDITAQVTPLSMTLGDTLRFKDSTSFAERWRWDFGDGNVAFSPSGAYAYRKPGHYFVRLTINNKFVDTFSVTVRTALPKISIQDSVTRIDGPAMGMQFENLVFRAVGRGTKQWRWKFGETRGTIDSDEPFVIYSYKDPGEYVVKLYTETGEYPVLHTVRILPAFKPEETDTTNTLDGLYKKIDDDFRRHLQAIADGEPFNLHYYYLLNTYLCKNEEAVTHVNNMKLNDFYSYCMGLRFDKGVKIQQVEVALDEEQNCVTKVTVKQRSKNSVNQ